MNETIGVKGGHNDRLRTSRIIRTKKLNDQRIIEELENKVKKQQKAVLVRTLPIVVLGGTFKTLYDVAHGKKPDKEEVNSKWRIKEYDTDFSTLEHGEKPKEKRVIVTPEGDKVVVYVDVVPERKNAIENILFTPISDTYTFDENDTNTRKYIAEKRFEKTNSYDNTNVKANENVSINNKSKTFPTGTSINNSDSKQNELSNSTEVVSNNSMETLRNLKARKILDEYEKKLKEVRYELRKLIFEYNVAVDDSDEIVFSEDAQILLDKLSDIVSRINELKNKIKIDNLDKYDDNYIYTLIEGYLDEFKEKRLVEEMKDSPLYILLSEKLDELETKRNSLDKKVDNKKEELTVKEVNFEQLKNKYYNVDKFNRDMDKFLEDQEEFLAIVQEKVAKAETIEEKVRVEVEALDRQSRRTLRFLTLQMFFPGARMAKGLMTTAASYLYFMRNIVAPRTVTRRYREIKVVDYSSEIESSISKLEEATKMLGKTSSQIDRMISLVYEEFGDYIGVLPECDDLLRNLKRIKNDIDEKEFEIQKAKEKQELILEKNNAKVKKRGEYPLSN